MVEKRLVDGRYRLDEVIGSGGMGVVWRAFDLRLGRLVAVKEVRFPSTMTDEERTHLTKRAMVEAQSAGRLDHPNIVPVHDVIVEDERPYIIMRLVEGGSLDQLVTTEGPLEPARAAAIGLELLDALSSAHASNIVHRDVKPHNVLFNRDGTALLSDFSIAAVFGSETLTRTGVLLGSPGYIAPERLMTGESGPSGDLFALGATLYFAVEGVGPFVATETIAGLFATAVRPHPRPERAGPLTPVLDGLLAKNPDERLTEAGTRAMLKGIVDGQGGAEPVTRSGEFTLPPPRELAWQPGTGGGGSSGGGSSGGGPPSRPEKPGEKPGGRQSRVLTVLAVLALAAAGLATFLVAAHGRSAHANLSLSPTPIPAPVTPTRSPTPSASTEPAENTSPTTSPSPTSPSPSATTPTPSVPIVKSAVLTLPKTSYTGNCTDFDIWVKATITLTTGPATVSYQVHQGGGEAYNGNAGPTTKPFTTSGTYKFHQHNAKTGNRTYLLTVSKPIWYEAKSVKFHMECVDASPITTSPTVPADPAQS